ncbi:Cold shock-like protein CspE [Photorhabdus australis subsp. thailandensis]|uniref:Cold shock-like protein CspE n=1 Tax=Photorhabdus australis subsp. thailandensis TaxID=2805096 RepID=A0A1C0U539_9GAMM|nr:cold shock domain-containing protein [Photorhabdus australis]OCQ53042.1 Cold shock-like protein CspE [Photorhabdus australis subsp. thailandensis]
MTLQLQMGKVKWFDENKGYGFISPQDGGQDIFVSRKAIANTKNKSLTEGQNVEFSIIRNGYSLAAADVIAF